MDELDKVELWLSFVPGWVFKVGSVKLKLHLIEHYIDLARRGKSAERVAYVNLDDEIDRDYAQMLHEADMRFYGIDDDLDE